MTTNREEILSSSLPTLRLDHLQAGNKEESKKLLDACRTHGFFYLDLSNHTKLCEDWDEMLALMKQYFEQPLEVKMQDARASDNTGYEPMGNEVGPYPETRDGYESLKISRRECLQDQIELSTALRDRSDFVFSFMREANKTLMLMLERLSNEMGLQGSARFESFHVENSPTLTNLALLRYPKHDDSVARSVGHNKHTDIGSLTFLLGKQWGLQILSHDTGKWEFVEPRANHAVINVGDSLHFPSGGQLASVVHRVIPVSEKQTEDRYSIAYLMRVNDCVRWKDSKGGLWSAKEWHDLKFNAFRASDKLENGMQVVTGMREENIILKVRGTAATSAIAA